MNFEGHGQGSKLTVTDNLFGEGIAIDGSS